MAEVVEAADGTFALRGMTFVELAVLSALLEDTSERWAPLATAPGLERDTMDAVFALDGTVDTFLAHRNATCRVGS